MTGHKNVAAFLISTGELLQKAIPDDSLNVALILAIFGVLWLYAQNPDGYRSSSLTCGSGDTLALVERLINEKLIEDVIKTKMILLPRFNAYLLNPSVLKSLQLSQKKLNI
jgi:hypothetical protein